MTSFQKNVGHLADLVSKRLAELELIKNYFYYFYYFFFIKTRKLKNLFKTCFGCWSEDEHITVDIGSVKSVNAATRNRVKCFKKAFPSKSISGIAEVNIAAHKPATYCSISNLSSDLLTDEDKSVEKSAIFKAKCDPVAYIEVLLEELYYVNYVVVTEGEAAEGLGKK